MNYNLIREFDTEYALNALNAHKERRVLIPDEEEIKNAGNRTAIMVADNIDNLESTTTGLGKTHRVNSILIISDVLDDIVLENTDELPVKRKCRRALTMKETRNQVPNYYAGTRGDPGELKNILQLNKSTEYKERKLKQNLYFFAWIALRTLKTLSSLLIPGWTGFNITRKNIFILNSKVSYLDTVDSPATDIKTAFEVLCRGNEIKERFNLKSLCVRSSLLCEGSRSTMEKYGTFWGHGTYGRWFSFSYDVDGHSRCSIWRCRCDRNCSAKWSYWRRLDRYSSRGKAL